MPSPVTPLALGPAQRGLVCHSDNLELLPRIADDTVDLIYIDPPFNTGRVQRRTQLRTVRDDAGDRVGFGGHRYRTERMSEQAYADSFADYEAFLAPRLEHAHRMLSQRGSLYVHLDYREVHYVKVLLDTIFGRDNFLNEIDFVGVRTLLNDGICNEQFKGVAADQARALQATANNALLFSPTPVPNDPYSRMAKIENSGSLRAISRQHAVTWELICRINNTTDRRIRIGQQLKTPFGPFHAVVWKQAYRMDLFLGGLPGEPGALYVTSLPVGLGKDDSTPTGLWSVVAGQKMKNPAWTNPRSGEHFEGYDPKNPLGGYWIALKGEEGNAVGKTSYGIHGTIEPDSIGKQASMGCIRLKVEDVQLVYDMMTDGKSRVLVRE